MYMTDKENINKNEQENATNKADNFDKEKEVPTESNNKSSTKKNDAADNEVMKEQKETD